jgi:hypothetical protein
MKLDFVTLFDHGIKEMGDLSLGRLKKYCAMHENYRCFYHSGLLSANYSPAWNKILAVRNQINQGFGNWVIWVDADVWILDLNFDLVKLLELFDPKNFIFSQDYNGLNTGVFAVRNCSNGLDLMSALLLLGDVADPDFYGPKCGCKWEQNTIKCLCYNFPKLNSQVGLFSPNLISTPERLRNPAAFAEHFCNLPYPEKLSQIKKLSSES